MKGRIAFEGVSLGFVEASEGGAGGEDFLERRRESK